MIRKNADLLQYITKVLIHKTDNKLLEVLYSPTEIILDQRKKVFYVHIIKSGMAKCYLTEDNGNDFIQEFFSEGEIFGELEAINGDLSFCCIEAITPVQAYKIEAQYFNTLLEKDPTFNKLILKALAKKLNYTAIRHAYNQSHTLEDNLLRLQKQYPALIEQISKQDIANYLGITVRSLNRSLAKLGI
ncbi:MULTISPECIES: Crp/Fnr family transcriptional regulator [Galbibacter]|uniref:Crp/Fnr family transcriptional regulator n=1 Tax=Galbibacter pacificus TaxID=2996052 RepID=A0ABT6FV21_9FLAO|nr:Crp/Fnr family transcriptional regulator [Galbibacter pacificus]MDG3583428.1 Crp/Fnr family transcriptional regulator [Galbibacter pacificus]MDG3587095.1 Crp/Fnr family transcriptional regulator [Galbibacter pacificus]